MARQHERGQLRVSEPLEQTPDVAIDRLLPHPAATIELQSRTAFLRALRELGLATEAADDTRPQRLTGRYQGRP